MARLPNWMATFGNHGAVRNAARAIDGHQTAALAVERQLASLPTSCVLTTTIGASLRAEQRDPSSVASVAEKSDADPP